MNLSRQKRPNRLNKERKLRRWLARGWASSHLVPAHDVLEYRIQRHKNTRIKRYKDRKTTFNMC